MRGMISWTGTISSIIGSFLVAFQTYAWGYLFFVVGSVLWLGIGILTKDKALAILNAFFLTANIVGIIGVLS